MENNKLYKFRIENINYKTKFVIDTTMTNALIKYLKHVEKDIASQCSIEESLEKMEKIATGITLCVKECEYVEKDDLIR